MTFIPDFGREKRCGIPEVIYGGGKTEEDLIEITERFLGECGRAILTKVDAKKAKGVLKKFKDMGPDYDQRAKVLVVKKKNFKTKNKGVVGIITAGTSDVPIAEEARIIAAELGLKTVVKYDAGVAGIHRLYPALKEMKKAGVLIVIAGMEGALPSVVSGLVDIPVIGVPTSVGYGTAEGGKTALFAMLNSCTPVAVVNIDNGYGAAVIAYKIIKNARA